MDPTKSQARIAGLIYLLVGLSAPVGLIYIPAKLIVSGDATATANHIRAAESLFRIGIGTELFHQTIFIFLVLALFRLLRNVSEPQAWLMVILGALVSVPIVFISVTNELAALALVSGANYLSVFTKDQLDAMAYLFLRLHGQGLLVAGVFWGLWLFPFGMLVIRSGFIPKILGFFLLCAGVGNLASSVTSILLPTFWHLISPLVMVLQWGELPVMLFFLIWGVTAQKGDRASAT
jgi:hypothetical protein